MAAELIQETHSRPPLGNDRFDVVVIGGGINGVAVALECARGGRRTLLVEQQDFGAGTTSRSTRIIHGGLRYLEHGDIPQVRESLREKQRLSQQYPHLVAPLEFLLVLGEGSRRSALTVRTGLWLYRKMTATPGRHRDSGSQEEKLERLLDAGRRFSILSFDDAQCEFPERLVAEWLVEAVEAGCVARNHTQVLTVEARNGQVTAVLLRDQIKGSEQRVETTWVVNATGPWADAICQNSAIQTKHPMVGGVRGSHVVLSRFAGAPDAAIYTEAIDGRPVFVIPWNGQLLVGTTEVPDNGDPGRVQPSADEVDYLLRSLRGLFPQARTSLSDVHYTFAGVRPLPYSPDSNPSATSRRHYLHDHASEGAAGMISVIGGKLTTAGSVGRECAAKLGIPVAVATHSPILTADQLDTCLDQQAAEVAETGGISLESARAVVEWFGHRAAGVVSSTRQNAELRKPLCPHTRHIVAEAVHAFAKERAATLADVLLRRVPVALGACWSPECSREAAIRIGAAVGWEETQVEMELEALDHERQAFLQKPAGVIG